MVYPKISGCKIAVVLLVSIASSFAAAPEQVSLTSPNQQVSVTLELVDGRPHWAVANGQQPILRPGRLGIAVNGNAPGAVDVLDWETEVIDETQRTLWGKTNSHHNHCTQGIWTLRETDQPQTTWRVIVRAYDSGVALRYEFPGNTDPQKPFRLSRELTEFRFAQDGRAWAYRRERAPLGPQPLATFVSGDGASAPLVVELAPDAYAAVLEAAIFDIAPFELKPLKHDKIGLRADFVKSTLPPGQPTAWRTLLLGAKPGDLLTSPLPYCLNPPNQIADTSWIQPGLAMWDWRAWGARTGDGFTYGLDMASWRRFIDFAARHGIPYLVLDANWYGPEHEAKSDPRTSRDHLVLQPDRTKPDVIRKPAPEDWEDPIDVPAIIRYGKERGVGIVLYYNDVARKNFPFEATLALYRDWGAAGIKYGFMRGRGQRKVLDTRSIVEACARYQLICNFHDGPVPPSGDRRTYPNYLSREFCHSQSDAMRVFSPTGFCEQVFVNMLAGPLDMCNGLYELKNPSRDRPRIFTNVESTVVAETARVMIVFSGMAILPDTPESYAAKADLFDFLSHMPGTWDETKILHGRIGEFITTARRSHDSWYIASANNEQSRMLPIQLDFLKPGITYTASLYEDAPDAHYQTNREAYQVRTTTVKQGDIIQAKMAPGGGHCIRLRPAE